MSNLDDILERDWQRTVTELARTFGYRVYHTYDSRRSTHGFPDLCLCRRNDRVIYLELKRERGKVTPEQVSWLADLQSAGTEAYLARPRHLDAVGAILGPRDTPRWHEARGVLLLELDTLGVAA